VTTRLMRHLAFMGLLALYPSTSQAQEPVGATALRIRWESDQPVSGLQAVCGRVFRSIGRFCLTMSAGAATYRVTIVGADWVAGPEAP
jgi:hypothetical protein